MKNQPFFDDVTNVRPLVPCNISVKYPFILWKVKININQGFPFLKEKKQQIRNTKSNLVTALDHYLMCVKPLVPGVH